MSLLESTHQYMFAQHNNDSSLVIDSRGSFDRCRRLFWLNRSRVLGMVEIVSNVQNKHQLRSVIVQLPVVSLKKAEIFLAATYTCLDN